MDKLLRRVSISLPVNKNTHLYIQQIITAIAKAFGGCTYSNFTVSPMAGHFTGVWKLQPKPEAVALVLADIDMMKYPDSCERLLKVIYNIKGTGEHVVWAIYHDVFLDMTGSTP